MNRWTVLLATMVVFALVALGCSGGGNPVAPTSEPDLTVGAQSHESNSQTHLWGFYDLYFDFESMTVEAVPNRDVMFAANVVQFLNQNPMNLQFTINGTPVGPDYVDVDIDVSTTHPFPGMTEYNGYDVRGIFMADGVQDMIDCIWKCGWCCIAKEGVDQFMRDYNMNEPPDEVECGNPDGYTRWWNPTEFITPGILGYMEGKVATPGYKASATVNPFKYFADGLGVCEDQWEFLTSGTTEGVFSAGATNTRNYYLRFPNTKGIRYNYAVVANWVDEETHPANAPEAVACSVTVTPDIYYVDAGDWGGDLILDISLFDWDSYVNSVGVMDDYTVAVVSWDLLEDATPTEDHQYVFSPAEMTPIGGGDHYSTYHVEIPVTRLEGREGNEFVVRAVCGLADGTVFEDYQNDYGVPNDAGVMPLTAYFRYPIYVNDEPYNQDPSCFFVVLTPMPAEEYGWVHVVCDATGSSDPDGDELTYHWDFDGDGNYDEDPDDAYTGDPWNPTHTYTESHVGPICLWLEDGQGGEAECCKDVDVTVIPTTLYHYDGTEDDGGITGNIPCSSHSWGYVSSAQCWDENGNTGGYSNNWCAMMMTPAFDVPSDVSSVRIRFRHWGRTEPWFDAGIMGISTNDGASVTWHRPGYVLFTYVSGENWVSESDYFYSVFYSSCCDTGYPTLPYSGWSGDMWQGGPWGNQSSPVETVFSFDGQLGTNNCRMVFGFKSDYSVTYAPGWCIREIEVYIEP